MHYRRPRDGAAPWFFAAALLVIALSAIFVVQRARQRDAVRGATKVALREEAPSAEASMVADRAPGFAISEVVPSAPAAPAVASPAGESGAAAAAPSFRPVASMSRDGGARRGGGAAQAVASLPTASAQAAPPRRPSAVSGPADTSAAAPERLTLEVATYIDAERAATERDRLAAESGLHGWVVTRFEGGVEAYKILLGVFRTSDHAEAAATRLLSRRLVSQARVVPLPPKGSRR